MHPDPSKVPGRGRCIVRAGHQEEVPTQVPSCGGAFSFWGSKSEGASEMLVNLLQVLFCEGSLLARDQVGLDGSNDTGDNRREQQPRGFPPIECRICEPEAARVTRNGCHDHLLAAGRGRRAADDQGRSFLRAVSLENPNSTRTISPRL